MAKTGNNYFDGFQGRIGPVVGYQWNGKWVIRHRPTQMHNPKTEKQMEHRSKFKQEVQLAASMRWPVTKGLTDAARINGMTAYNLFVRLNQPCFALSDGELAVDYASLTLSVGPVAPIALGTPTIDNDNTLTVSFDKNPLRIRMGQTDLVNLFVYCPSQKRGISAEPVFRHKGRVAVALPNSFSGQEVHVYAFVQDSQGLCSTTSYAAPESQTEPPALPPAEPVVAESASEVSPAPSVAAAPADTPPAPADPMQLTLW